MEIYYKDVTTASGYSGDVIISAMQKFIRRGMVEEAAQAAYELFLCGGELAEYMWKRLLVISVEDVGLGEPGALMVVRQLHETARELGYDHEDYPVFFIHAVRYLCSCGKDRDSSVLKSLVKRRIKRGDRISCPDFVYDMHTERGQRLGRDYDHFFREAAKVIPETEITSNSWKEELIQMIKEGY